jgi:hypothetical protein
MIVGIGYKKRRGKDTGADALVRDLNFVKHGFSYALKELALAANPVVVTEPRYENVRHGHNTLEYLVERTGWEYAKDHYPEVRQFLQKLGTGARTVFGADFWVDQWQSYVKGLIEGTGADVVVPDVRYLNEAERLKEMGAFLIRINRPILAGTHEDHESETQLDGFDGWDVEIDNDAGVVDLERQIVELVRNAQKSNTSSAENVAGA